ncbi:hypothetical protein BD626DRAFT_482501 [Schizophyllum amplum]|uniref:Uncharacterized protein n=1 Tax=Schizophyllum amplum TaxID=97359 RepID=A0A550CV72_9AGAR|nr:hypothetical protein BD626DRAFT_482501 [Auriculariopsis ampla]
MRSSWRCILTSVWVTYRYCQRVRHAPHNGHASFDLAHDLAFRVCCGWTPRGGIGGAVLTKENSFNLSGHIP